MIERKEMNKLNFWEKHVHEYEEIERFKKEAQTVAFAPGHYTPTNVDKMIQVISEAAQEYTIILYKCKVCGNPLQEKVRTL